MRKIISIFLLCFILMPGFGQTQKKVSTYLFAQYTNTMYDITSGNNPWGAGLGLQTFFNNRTDFKLTIELTGDLYLMDDKVGRVRANDILIDDVPGMVNLFVGSSFQPNQNFYLSFLAGPSFIGERTLLGIKPSLGFYFDRNQKWTGKFSYINIFNRDIETKEDFGSVSFAIGLKLF
jgi:hypothetical protein